MNVPHLSGVGEGDAAVDGGADEGVAVLVSTAGPWSWLSSMQPGPIAETLGPLLPSVCVIRSVLLTYYLDGPEPVSAVIVLSCVRAAMPDGQPA